MWCVACSVGACVCSRRSSRKDQKQQEKTKSNKKRPKQQEKTKSNKKRPKQQEKTKRNKKRPKLGSRLLLYVRHPAGDVAPLPVSVISSTDAPDTHHRVSGRSMHARTADGRIGAAPRQEAPCTSRSRGHRVLESGDGAIGIRTVVVAAVLMGWWQSCMCMCMCVCARACVRVRVCACVCACARARTGTAATARSRYAACLQTAQHSTAQGRTGPYTLPHSPPLTMVPAPLAQHVCW